MKVLKNILLTVALFSFVGCMNQYEERAVGEYGLYRYELKAGPPGKHIDGLAQLILKSNNTFELNYDGKKMDGNWTADDNGDSTILLLSHDGKIDQGRIGQTQIDFGAVNFPGMDCFESLQFTKM